MEYRPRLLEGNVNVVRTHPLKELALLVGGMAGILVLVYLLLGLAVDLVVPRISVEMERAIAAVFPLEEDEGDQRSVWLSELARELAAFAPQDPGPLEIGIVGSPVENAFALPGNRIVILSPLLRHASSVNEVAFVVAHEMGHLANRDVLRSFGRAIVVSFLASFLLGNEDSVRIFIGDTLTLGHLHYSRDQERAADLFALETVVGRYGHAGGALAFFERDAWSDERPRLKPPELLSTHPETRRRIAYLRETMARRGYAEEEPAPLPEELRRKAGKPEEAEKPSS